MEKPAVVEKLPLPASVVAWTLNSYIAYGAKKIKKVQTINHFVVMITRPLFSTLPKTKLLYDYTT